MRDVAAEVERLLRAGGWWLVHREASKTTASNYLFFAKPDGGECVVRVSDHRVKDRKHRFTRLPMLSIVGAWRARKCERCVRWISNLRPTLTP